MTASELSDKLEMVVHLALPKDIDIADELTRDQVVCVREAALKIISEALAAARK